MSHLDLFFVAIDSGGVQQLIGGPFFDYQSAVTASTRKDHVVVKTTLPSVVVFRRIH